jgi:hypothetical protein
LIKETFGPETEEMNLSDTFYVALCMTVLILGIVYWFWTQNQFIQRKLNLLENIVYEMRSASNAHIPEGLVDKALAAAAASAVSTDTATSYAPAPGLDEDDLHAALSEELDLETEDVKPMPEESGETELFKEAEVQDKAADEIVFEDALAPGASLGTSNVEDLGATKGGVLDAMTLKELKQLAEQKGVKGAKSMRKHELVEAIRNSKVSISPFDVHEATSVSLE